MIFLHMYKTIIVIFALGAGMLCRAQTPSPLSFGADKEFRIVQFTDMHLDPGSEYKRLQSEKTFARLGRVLSETRPDLVAFTGDIVTGCPAESMWNRLLDSMAVYRIPFCVVMGNHDAEQDLSRVRIAELVTSSPYSLNVRNSSGELADMEIKIASSIGKADAAALYFMDSHDYSTVKGVDGYGWFYPQQVDWIRKCSKEASAGNGGDPLPSLAFFHIALPEYVQAWDRREYLPHIGRAAEAQCPGALNTGMFAAMVEEGNIMGTFVGHDHDIDYMVVYNGVALGYGRFSGDDTTYNNLRPGVRIIVLEEGKRTFSTWICEDDGRIVDHVLYDNGKMTELK